MTSGGKRVTVVPSVRITCANGPAVVLTSVLISITRCAKTTMIAAMGINAVRLGMDAPRAPAYVIQRQAISGIAQPIVCRTRGFVNHVLAMAVCALSIVPMRVSVSMAPGVKPKTAPNVGPVSSRFAIEPILLSLSNAVAARAPMQMMTVFVMQTTGYAIETAANSSVEWLSLSVGAVKSQWLLMDVMTAVLTGRTAALSRVVETMMIVLLGQIAWPVNAPLAFVLLSFSPSAVKTAIHTAMHVSRRAKVLLLWLTGRVPVSRRPVVES